MSKRLVPAAICLLLWSIVVEAGYAQARPADPRPNIVLILADDLGYGDLGSYGHPSIRTPALDRLAAEGMRLTSFYAAAPICTPSRAALLTGRYSTRVGLPRVLGPSSTDGLAAAEITLAEALRDRGYRTMAVGKWHLGHARPEFLPTGQGFDSYFGLLFSNDMIPPWVPEGPPLRFHDGTGPLEGTVDQSTLTRRYTEEAVRFVESGDRPFFLYLAHSMPHVPLYASPERAGRSRAGRYGDVIEEMDGSVGQILDALRRTGKAENTIVIFTSDNGPWLDPGERTLQGGVEPWDFGSAGPFRGAKLTSYEGGVRVPAIIRWPARIPPGQTSAEMVTALDLFPTLVAAAGAVIPTDRAIDGGDVLPVLDGRHTVSSERTFFFVLREVVEGVREGRWKLRVATSEWTDHRVELPAGEIRIQLFDVERDPSERYDVAHENPAIVARLEARIREFARTARATLPTGFSTRSQKEDSRELRRTARGGRPRTETHLSGRPAGRIARP